MQTLGEYCSISEMPLHAEAHVWHKAEFSSITNSGTGRQTTTRKITPDEWDQVLLIDTYSYSATKSSKVLAESLFAWPDEMITFSVGPDSPFHYALEEITQITFADGTDTVADEQSIKRVVVKGNTEAAQNTIDHFALNTRYYNETDKTLSITQTDLDGRADPRLDLRTNAWNNAMEFMENLAKAEGNERIYSTLIGMGRMIISGNGFWSTWATVIRQFTKDDNVYQSMLFQPQEDRKNRAHSLGVDERQADYFLGPGPHNVFPGTRRE